MNVHITSTPEFSNEETREIVNLLSETTGAFNFVFKESLVNDQLALKINQYETPDNIEVFSFEELFDIGTLFRRINKIPNEDYVVVITSYPNTKKWFSAFKDKNIFVHGSGWDYFTNRDSKFGISYQIVENIFQSLIDLNIDTPNDEPNIHINPIGCINDFCGKKKDVYLKLQTANICISCSDRALGTEHNVLLFNHIFSIIKRIGLEFNNTNRFQLSERLPILKIDENAKITVNNREIIIEPVPKSFYIFILDSPDGVFTHEIREDNELFKVLTDLYTAIKGNSNNIGPIEKLKVEKNIYQRVNNVKDAFINVLGDELGKHYVIQSVEENKKAPCYKVLLSEDDYELNLNF